MSLDPPFPALDDVMLRIGEAGRRMADIGASEGAAGNISVYIGWPIDFQPVFPLVKRSTCRLPRRRWLAGWCWSPDRGDGCAKCTTTRPIISAWCR